MIEGMIDGTIDGIIDGMIDGKFDTESTAMPSAAGASATMHRLASCADGGLPCMVLCTGFDSLSDMA